MVRHSLATAKYVPQFEVKIIWCEISRIGYKSRWNKNDIIWKNIYKIVKKTSQIQILVEKFTGWSGKLQL